VDGQERRRFADVRRAGREPDAAAHEHAAEVVGRSEPAARALAEQFGLTIRVRTGGWYTAEYQLGRITVDVVDGTVVAAMPG
jgi:hypothetical protein